MFGDHAVPAGRGAGLARRVAVTVVAVALFAMSRRVVLPFLDADAVRSYTGRSPLALIHGGVVPFVSWGALGLMPFVAAFVLVELIAATVPAFRPLRDSAAGRRRLDRVAGLVGVPLAAVQAWGLVVELPTMRDTFGYPLLDPTTGAMVTAAVALVVGSAGLAVAAAVVSRHGLGNGYAVLLAAGALEPVADAVIRAVAGPPLPWTEAGAILVVATVLLPIVFAFRPRDAGRPRVAEPTCGLVPVVATPLVLDFPSKLADWTSAAVPLEWWVHDALESEAARAGAWISISGILAFALARAFSPPREVVAAFELAADTRGDGGEPAARRALRSANARSVALVLAIASFPVVAQAAGVPVAIPRSALVAVFVIAAVVLDLRDEASARSCCGPLASAWPAHRVFAVAPALAALEGAGVPAHARSRRFRTLFHLFAPFAPIEILVPPDRFAEAEAVCARVLRPSPNLDDRPTT